MSTTDGISVMSVTSTYCAVLPEASVDTISLGTPTGSVRIAAVIIAVPPPPPRPSTASMRPSRCSAGTSAQAPRSMASMAGPRSRAARSAARSAPPARATSAAGMSAANGGSPRTPRSITSVRTPRCLQPFAHEGVLRALGVERAGEQDRRHRGQRPRRRAQRGPRRLAGHVDQRRPLEHGRRQDGEEHEVAVAGVVGPVHHVGGDVGDVTRAEEPRVAVDPLLGAAGDDVDDLFHRGVTVERVPLAGRHRHPHQHQLLRGGQRRSATATRAGPTARPRRPRRRPSRNATDRASTWAVGGIIAHGFRGATSTITR